MKGIVARVLPFSSVDGPGNRSVVFLQGCNFNCTYCHNPETIPILKSPGEMEHVHEMTVEEVISQINKVRAFISGVTISGGECSVQFDFLMALIAALKEEKYHVLIDSNGNIPAEKFKKILTVADGFMLDLKAWNLEEHIALTGTTNSLTIAAIEMGAVAGKLYELRTVVVPQQLSSSVTVKHGAELIVKYNDKILYKLIKYRAHGVREEYDAYRQPTHAEMLELEHLAREIGCKNVVII